MYAATAVGSVRNTWSSPTRSRKPDDARSFRRSCFTRASAKDDVPALELLAHLVERVDRREVDLDVHFRVEDQPFDWLVSQVERGQRATLEVFCVGE